MNGRSVRQEEGRLNVEGWFFVDYAHEEGGARAACTLVALTFRCRFFLELFRLKALLVLDLSFDAEEELEGGGGGGVFISLSLMRSKALPPSPAAAAAPLVLARSAATRARTCSNDDAGRGRSSSLETSYFTEPYESSSPPLTPPPSPSLAP